MLQCTGGGGSLPRPRDHHQGFAGEHVGSGDGHLVQTEGVLREGDASTDSESEAGCGLSQRPAVV